MKTKDVKKKPIMIAFLVSLLVCIVLAWVLLIYMGDLKEKEHFKQMYPNTDRYLQESYGKYYKKSNIILRGKVTVIFYVDEDFFKKSKSKEKNIDDYLTYESSEVYNKLLEDCNGDVKHLEIVFLTYRFHEKYYNFAYQKQMKKTDEMYFWPIS